MYDLPVLLERIVFCTLSSVAHPRPLTWTHTGAGWGGCSVSLVQEDQVEAFLAEVKKSYYQKLIDSGVTKEEEMEHVLFATKPSSGAAVLRLTFAASD